MYIHIYKGPDAAAAAGSREAIKTMSSKQDVKQARLSRRTPW